MVALSLCPFRTLTSVGPRSRRAPITALGVDAFLYGALIPTSDDHDLLVHALNERFVELGGNHPVPYLEDGQQ